MVDHFLLVVYHTVKSTAQSALKLTKKLIRTETVTITKTQEVSVVDNKNIFGKKEIWNLIQQSIKKILLGFLGKGEKDNESSY